MILPLLFDLPFLKANLAGEFAARQAAGNDAKVLDRLQRWAKRDKLKETSSEAAFIANFFQDLWGYAHQGSRADGIWHSFLQFPVARAGQGGGQSKADLALGHCSTGRTDLPQVLCEFKDVRSGLDAPQHRNATVRAPVQRVCDYLWQSRTNLTKNDFRGSYKWN